METFTKTNWPMLFRIIITVYCENRVNPPSPPTHTHRVLKYVTELTLLWKSVKAKLITKEYDKATLHRAVCFIRLEGFVTDQRPYMDHVI